MPRRRKNQAIADLREAAEIVVQTHLKCGEADVFVEIGDVRIEIRRPAIGKTEDIVHGAEKAAKAVGKLIRRRKKRDGNSS